MTAPEPVAAHPADPVVSGAPANRRPLLLLFGAQLVGAVVLGLIWLAWSPHATAYELDNGTGHGVIVPAEGESLVAADGRFVLLTVLSGLAVGVIAWQLRRWRGRLMLTALVVSSLLASAVTKIVGQALSGGQHSSALNTAFRPPLVLHASAALFAQALVAALVYTVFVGLSGDPELGLRPEPAPVATEVPAG